MLRFAVHLNKFSALPQMKTTVGSAIGLIGIEQLESPVDCFHFVETNHVCSNVVL